MEKSITTVTSTHHLFSLRGVTVFRGKLPRGIAKGCEPTSNLACNQRHFHSCERVPNNHASCRTVRPSPSCTHLDETLSKSHRRGRLRQNSTSMHCGHIFKKERTPVNMIKAQSQSLTREVLLNIALVQIDAKSSRLSRSRFYHRKKEEENKLNQTVTCNMKAKQVFFFQKNNSKKN